MLIVSEMSYIFIAVCCFLQDIYLVHLASRIEVPCGMCTRVGPRNHVWWGLDPPQEGHFEGRHISIF